MFGEEKEGLGLDFRWGGWFLLYPALGLLVLGSDLGFRGCLWGWAEGECGIPVPAVLGILQGSLAMRRGQQSSPASIPGGLGQLWVSCQHSSSINAEVIQELPGYFWNGRIFSLLFLPLLGHRRFG